MLVSNIGTDYQEPNWPGPYIPRTLSWMIRVRKTVRDREAEALPIPENRPVVYGRFRQFKRRFMSIPDG